MTTREKQWKNWSDADDAELHTSESHVAVAAKLGCGVQAVKHRRRKLKCQLGRVASRRFTTEEIARLRVVYTLPTKPVEALAVELGRTVTSLRLKASELGLADRFTHHGRKAPEYRNWANIKTRCFNPNCVDYNNYGGRGITMCERWRQSFAMFLADMGSRPSLMHSIDRFPDRDGNYEPGNCRWATPAEQGANTRRAWPLTSGTGETMTINAWAQHLSISGTTLWRRVWRGETIDDIIASPRTSVIDGRCRNGRRGATRSP
jgi:hypothetical protein